MKGAFRLSNWIVAYWIIRVGSDASKPAEAAFTKEFTASLGAHREFIAGNLEFAETSIHPNHYLANLGGLLLGSSFLAEHLFTFVDVLVI